MNHRIEKAIEDAFEIATTYDLKNDIASQRHFKFMLRQIAVNSIETIRNEQNDIIFKTINSLK